VDGWNFGDLGCWQDGRMGVLGGGELLVVETEDDWFLGVVEVLGDVLVVRSGFRGRPAVVRHEDVVRVVPLGDVEDASDLTG
jgi:hypothetical protein